MKAHVQKAAQKALVQATALGSLRKLSSQAMRQLYLSTVASKLDYAASSMVSAGQPVEPTDNQRGTENRGKSNYRCLQSSIHSNSGNRGRAYTSKASAIATDNVACYQPTHLGKDTPLVDSQAETPGVCPTLQVINSQIPGPFPTGTGVRPAPSYGDNQALHPGCIR